MKLKNIAMIIKAINNQRSLIIRIHRPSRILIVFPVAYHICGYHCNNREMVIQLRFKYGDHSYAIWQCIFDIIGEWDGTSQKDR